MRAVYIKELRSYFTSATGYIFMAVFLLLSGIFFALTNLLQTSAYYNSVLQSITFIFLILVPMITMRSIAEESRLKTDQLLYTAPVSLTRIVIGKYLAAVTLFFITVAITFIYPVIMSMFGTIGVWEIIGNYIGFALMGASFIAIGIFISSLTENQVAAAVGTFGVLLFIWLIDWIQQGVPTSQTAGLVFVLLIVIIVAVFIYFSTWNSYAAVLTASIGGIIAAIVYFANKALYEGFAAKFLGWFSLLKRYDDFSMGLLDMSSIVYYITFCTVFVFLTIRMIDKRRWS
jgi:ABC-2 type transport system permease protein